MFFVLFCMLCHHDLFSWLHCFTGSVLLLKVLINCQSFKDYISFLSDRISFSCSDCFKWVRAAFEIMRITVTEPLQIYGSVVLTIFCRRFIEGRQSIVSNMPPDFVNPALKWIEVMIVKYFVITLAFIATLICVSIVLWDDALWGWWSICCSSSPMHHIFLPVACYFWDDAFNFKFVFFCLSHDDKILQNWHCCRYGCCWVWIVLLCSYVVQEILVQLCQTYDGCSFVWYMYTCCYRL